MKLSPAQAAQFIEGKRIELEQELLALTGYHVIVSASVHSHIDNVNSLAVGAAVSGFKIKKSDGSVWLQTDSKHNSGNTAIFVSTKGQS